MQIIESSLAVEQKGTEPKEIQQDRGGFWARVFDPDPTLPLWQKTKTVVIQVPHYEPVMYRLMDKLIVHPSLIQGLIKAIEKQNSEIYNPSRVFKW